MNKEEAIAALEREVKEGDKELAHRGADLVLCELLESLGYGDVVKEYHKVSKWYV